MSTKKIHEVVAIVDRSGSMIGKEQDTIGGLNSTFDVLKENKDEDLDIYVSIKLFDHEEKLLIRSLKLEEVKKLELHQYRPRGQTALLDAIGNSLNYFIEKKIKDEKSYDICTIYIVTDGLENCSKNFDTRTIKKIISNAEENYNIKILYLGANQDAILEANKYGIDSSQALNYSENSTNVNNAYRSAANAAYRHASSNNASFTQQERQDSQVPLTN